MKHYDVLWEGVIPISYGLLIVHDSAAIASGLRWSRELESQGFARQESCLNAATLIQHGEARCRVLVGAPLEPNTYERVISVPFVITSGALCVGGAEEVESRVVHIRPKHYRLFVGQALLREDAEACDLWLSGIIEPEPRSRIHVRDRALTAEAPFIEWTPAADTPE